MFTLWIQPVTQRIANDGVWNYGINQGALLWQQPIFGGAMKLFYPDGQALGVATYTADKP